MLFVRGATTPYAPSVKNIRCPACRHAGAFHGIDNVPDALWVNPPNSKTRSGPVQCQAGMRKCPNLDCGAILFVGSSHPGEFTIYPPEVLDFDASNLPPQILASLEEAVLCHSAGAHKASALMVRRTLEELCEDKGAKGKNLKERLMSLSSVAVIPGELLIAADELRVLGNDAAHIEAKTYDTIHKAESTLAIELAKELLKAVYQYSSLLSKLQALKKAKPV
jgi:hypothetical protein